MKILLLNPPTFDNKAFIREGRCTQIRDVWATMWPPITLATAGAMLEAEGHSVEILDCPAQDIQLKDLLVRIQRTAYGLIAWSSATPSIKSDLVLANEIKNIDSSIKTATFGTHVTTLTEECFREAKGLDAVIRNEPEESLVALAECLENETGPEGIKGLSYRGPAGQVFHNPERHFIRDLDSIPFPAWHLLDLKRYLLPLTGEKFLILSPVRGCPYLCNFCTARTYYGKKLRRKSVPRVIDEIENNINRFGINQFFIWADTFTADNDYVMNLCHAIGDSGLKINWTCNSRVDTVNQVLLKTMAKAGCWMISYGIESANPAILDSAGKNTNPGQSQNAVRMAKNAGIKVVGHFVLGLPGETVETIKETIDFALALNMDMAQFYCAVPFPGSPLYALAKREGWIEGRGYDEFRQDNAVMNLPGLPSSTVNKLRKSGFRRFYLRPDHLAQTLCLIRFARIVETIKQGIKFLGWTAGK